MARHILLLHVLISAATIVDIWYEWRVSPKYRTKRKLTKYMWWLSLTFGYLLSNLQSPQTWLPVLFFLATTHIHAHLQYEIALLATTPSLLLKALIPHQALLRAFLLLPTPLISLSIY